MNVATEVDRRWYLVLTKASDELIAHHHLSGQGYETYYPRLIRRVRVRGRRVRRICPLFPRYLFLQLLVGIQDIHPVRYTKGVLSIVRFGGQYAIVPDAVIQRLQGHANPSTGLHQLDDRRILPHQSVRITDGTFGGLEGVFLRESGDDRVVVLLSILGQNRPVEISEAWVEPSTPERNIRAA